MLAPDGLPRCNLAVDNFKYMDHLCGMFYHPMDDRMVGGNRFADAILSVQLQCSDVPLDLLDGLFHLADDVGSKRFEFVNTMSTLTAF